MTNTENTQRDRQDIINDIIEYFEENEEIFEEAIEELDSYNGYLGDNRYYSMDELDELYHGVEPSEILARAFYGYDEDNTYTDESGREHTAPFNPNRDYFTYNGYGNLVSTDYKDYSAYNDEYFVEQLEEHRNYIYAIEDNEELTELFDSLEADNEENDEEE